MSLWLRESWLARVQYRCPREIDRSRQEKSVTGPRRPRYRTRRGVNQSGPSGLLLPGLLLPIDDVELARPRRGHQLTDLVQVDGRRVHREQHSPALDVLHDVIDAPGGNAGILQRRRQAACDVARGFAEPGRERARGDNGPIPGRTTAMAASTWPLSSPSLAAARESSMSTPGDASICSASAPSSSWLRESTEISSREMPYSCSARAAAAAAAGLPNNARTRGCAIGGMLLRLTCLPLISR